MNPIYAEIPLLARHAGTWSGVYSHVRPDLSVVDRHRFTISVELPQDEAFHYRQTSRYWWEDGRTRDVVFDARCENGRLVWDNGRIRGALWQLDDATLYLWFGFHDDPDVVIYEMMQLSPDGQARARTWHWLRHHRLFQITLVDEAREGDAPSRAAPSD